MASQESAFDAFSFTHDPLMPCTPNTDIFDPATFTVSAPFFDSYAPSPDCSMPGTPTTPVDGSFHRIATPPTHYQSNYDFFDLGSFNNVMTPAMCAPMHEQSLIMPSFCGASKTDFACYGGSGLAPFEGGLSPPFITSIPTY